MGFLKNQKNNKGFTIIEIVVTIGLIGLLTAIAVPAYNHQVNLAKQKEAKANLAALSSTEKSFFAEYSAVTGRLDALGFKPTGTLNYNVGFTGDQAPPANSLNQGSAACINTGGGTGNCVPSFAGSWTNNAGTVVTTNLGASGPASFVGGTAWTAYARAHLTSVPSPAGDDEWKIDSHDSLINSQPGF